MIRRNRSYLFEFTTRLRELKGLRATRERTQIVQHIHAEFRQREEFTAEEVYESVKNAPRRVSRATVYRTLGCLVEVELLDRLEQELPSQPDPQMILYRVPAAWRD